MLELNENDLVPVEVKCLTLEESIDELFKGNVIVLQNYEKTRGKDILVRLNDKKYKVTEISHDANIFEYEKPYWQIHNVSLNAISLHNVYKKEVYDTIGGFKLLPGSVVQILQRGELVLAVIDNVYRVEGSKDMYYTLSDREGYYKATEIESIVTNVYNVVPGIILEPVNTDNREDV